MEENQTTTESLIETEPQIVPVETTTLTTSPAPESSEEPLPELPPTVIPTIPAPVQPEEPTLTQSEPTLVQNLAPVPQTTPEPVIPQSEPVTTQPSRLRQLLDKALITLDLRKQKRFEKIMTLAQKKGSINNDDTQKLLRVSDTTASRYLGALARQGKLNRVGNGKATVFKPL